MKTDGAFRESVLAADHPGARPAPVDAEGLEVTMDKMDAHRGRVGDDDLLKVVGGCPTA